MRIRIVSVLFVIIIISIGSFLNMARATTETQKYETHFKEGSFEIRFYPKANLNKLKLQYKNNFEVLGYNPPFQLLNRRNEIQVELENFNPEMVSHSEK